MVKKKNFSCTILRFEDFKVYKQKLLQYKTFNFFKNSY